MGTIPIAELGMYPFASVRWAWEALWRDVHGRAPWTPQALTFTDDVHTSWRDPKVLVNHICGWPLARFHADDQLVVGAFELAVPTAVGHRYRSTIVSTRDASLEQLTAERATVAVNGLDSLSGWVSLLAATGGGPWQGAVTITGAHVESLRALSQGVAELACIDSWSLALLDCEQPDLTHGLHRVGFGPLVPSPAVTVCRSVAAADADRLAEALIAAIADDSSAKIREVLMISGFHRSTLDEYLPVLDLAAW